MAPGFGLKTLGPENDLVQPDVRRGGGHDLAGAGGDVGGGGSLLLLLHGEVAGVVHPYWFSLLLVLD